MRLYTSHFHQGQPPTLVREGFSWAAFLFGWLYLATRRAYLAACLNLAVLLLVMTAARLLGSLAPLLGLAILQGVFGADLCRWNLAQRGFTQGPVVAGADPEQAMLRLLSDGAALLPAGHRADLALAAR
jgi:hypothetical protein